MTRADREIDDGGRGGEGGDESARECVAHASAREIERAQAQRAAPERHDDESCSRADQRTSDEPE